MRSIVEVLKREEFRPQNEGGPGAEGRLANRRLQPLGHLTAGAKCTWNQHLADPHFTLAEAAVFQTVAFVRFDRKIA